MSENALVIRQRDEGRMTYTVTDAGLAAIERMAAEGNADGVIAKALSVNVKALRRLRDEDERVADAYEYGKARLATELTDILLNHAREGNVTAAIYLSKARLGWRDQGPAPHAGNAVQVNIHMPAPMSDEEFKRMVESKEVKNG